MRNKEEEDEIQDLLTQLEQLQLQQTDLITRLGRLSRVQGSKKDKDTAGPTNPIAARDFAIGDRVRIKNPRPFQERTGIIAKIGTGRITVQTRNGNRIVQASKNLSILA